MIKNSDTHSWHAIRYRIKLLYPLGKELDGIIKSYAEKNGIDIVLNKVTPAIVHASNKIDITNPIMNLFNKRYKEKSDKAKKSLTPVSTTGS